MAKRKRTKGQITIYKTYAQNQCSEVREHLKLANLFYGWHRLNTSKEQSEFSLINNRQQHNNIGIFMDLFFDIVQNISRIYFIYSNHNLMFSSFMTYHWVSNTKCPTGVAGTAYHPENVGSLSELNGLMLFNRFL